MLLKRGQVTVFIIVGILLLAIVGFMFYIVSEIQVGELKAEQEQIIGKTFQKEALRIFVEDCLTDSLEEGLVLIGEQGRLWSTDPGSSAIHFLDGFTGITFLTNYSVYYAITYREELEYPNSYPCEDNRDESPAFCKYEYPNPATFGDKGNIGADNIESDLKSYMINQSSECVSEFLLSNLSISSQIEEEEIVISKLEIETDGISIDVQYPLELVVEDEVYFHLVDFSFFYPSPKLNDMLSKAVSDPLNREVGNVTFDITNQTVLETLSEVYRDLDTEVQNFSVDADTVIRYEFEAGDILKSKPYMFQFAIENRPPALDYASKFACSNYDYLVLSGDDTELGEINIAPNALDPDDDIVTYTFSPETFSAFDPEWSIDETTIFAEVPEGAESGIYNLTINSTDGHGLSDWQIVRILVDPRVEVDMWIATPYNNFTDSSATISIEDPVFLYINVTATGDIQGEILLNTLTYENGVAENFTVSTALTGGLNCIPLPYDSEEDPPRTCDTASYEDDIETWTEFYVNEINESPYFSQTTPLGNPGVLDYELNIDYCGEYSQTPDDHIDLTVQACTPWPGVEGHPYPYILGYEYHHILVNTSLTPEDLGYILPETEEISPFLANHSCCDEGTVKDEGEVCYESIPGCYGTMSGLTWEPNYPGGYVLEVRRAYCDGERGNICGGSSSIINTTPYGDYLTCGNSSANPECDAPIEELCQGEHAWGYVDTNGDNDNDVWCHGTMGCSEVCDKETDAVVFLYGETGPSSEEDLLSRVLSNEAVEDDDTFSFRFGCGCTQNDVTLNHACDADFDGVFGGNCQAEWNGDPYCLEGAQH